MRGVDEVVSHSGFPALLFSGTGVWDMLLVLFALTVNSIIIFWQDQTSFSAEFYFRSMPRFAKQTH